MISLSKSPKRPRNGKLVFSTFSAHVRKEDKEKRSIPQHEVARHTGLSRNTVMNFLHGDTRRVDLDKIEDLAAYYDVPVIDLLFWEVRE